MSSVIAVKNADGIELVDLETIRYVHVVCAEGEVVISADKTPGPTAEILEIVERYFSATAGPEDWRPARS